MSGSEHKEEILDQFTRQAAQFAQSATARDEELLRTILRMAEPQPRDAMLDVACGPGMLVCAFAPQVRHATGIDLTPAMLDQARAAQDAQGLANISWDCGDVTALPYQDGSFNIVTCRYAFHHFPDPLAVLTEMRRVCAPGGRVVVVDSAPEAGKAAAFNAMEKLRDPSHTRALPREELAALYAEVGLPAPRVEHFRLELDLESFLARSYPREGDEVRLRAVFESALVEDMLDLQPRQVDGKIFFAVPTAILSARIPHAA
ncbi:MAG: methyltransferase domain-containing protein [Acidobacteria bacterium]|nr:methyltransferase domain-containing protein [Acidobacteriota bacterium]